MRRHLDRGERDVPLMHSFMRMKNRLPAGLLIFLLGALAPAAWAQSAPSADAQSEARRCIETALQQRTPEAQLRGQLAGLGITDPSLSDALNYYRKELTRRETLDAVKPGIQPGKAPVKGSPAAPVTIIEVSDFECPFCGKVQPTLQQLEREYPGKLRIAFKHFPLPNHKQARPAAAAAQAAQRQGKFWEMHDYLFARQTDLEQLFADDFAAAAAALKLSPDRFKADYQALLKDQSAIEADIAEAKKWLVDSTPAFFINGEPLVGAKPAAAFKKLIDAALAAPPAVKKSPATKKPPRKSAAGQPKG